MSFRPVFYDDDLNVIEWRGTYAELRQVALDLIRSAFKGEPWNRGDRRLLPMDDETRVEA